MVEYPLQFMWKFGIQILFFFQDSLQSVEKQIMLTSEEGKLFQ